MLAAGKQSVTDSLLHNLREFVKTTVILAPGARCSGGANCTFPTIYGSVPDVPDVPEEFRGVNLEGKL